MTYRLATETCIRRPPFSLGARSRVHINPLVYASTESVIPSRLSR